MKATKCALIGRTIVDVDFRPFKSENGTAHAPRITLDNGRVLYFVTEETGGAEYGTFIGITKGCGK